jgi:argininosuccinate synthase
VASYETPGGTILHAAHRGLESITMDREVLHLRDSLIPRFAEMIYYGYWFAPEREVLQKAIDASQANVSGCVRLKLYKGTSWSSDASPIFRFMIPTSPPSKRTRFIDRPTPTGSFD